MVLPSRAAIVLLLVAGCSARARVPDGSPRVPDAALPEAPDLSWCPPLSFDTSACEHGGTTLPWHICDDIGRQEAADWALSEAGPCYVPFGICNDDYPPVAEPYLRANVCTGALPTDCHCGAGPACPDGQVCVADHLGVEPACACRL